MTGGYPTVTIIENGNVEKGDEWALFRLTDEGQLFYNEPNAPDLRACIMSIKIDSKPAVVELVPRYTTEQKAIDALNKLSKKEKARTLLRSVRPVK